MIPTALALVLVLLAPPVLVGAVYLSMLALLSRRQTPPAAPAAPTLRFDLVVPAHDEARGIASTVHSLLAVDYPAALRRVLVVADNCSDATAALAREAGALVLERTDAAHRGKGYALAHAFERCLADGWADAVVVVDADTVVSKNLLVAFSARLAAGEVAVQAYYGVRNPNASWRTRLLRIALAMFHQVRSLARERLGVSCGLRGNGMCFAAPLLREVPHDAFSLVEDLEYGVRLGRAGHRVAYAWEAEVLGEMVSGEQGSRSQRARWEHGRAQLAKALGWPLLREGLRRRSALLVDLAMDVLLPPLSRVVVAAAGGALASAVLVATTGVGLLPSSLYGLALTCLAIYVFAGWWHSGTGARGLLDLALAPGYVAWKLTLLVKERTTKRPAEWVRTTREEETRT